MKDRPCPNNRIELRTALENDPHFPGPTVRQWELLDRDGTIDSYLQSPGMSQYEQVVRRLRGYQSYNPGRTTSRKTATSFDDDLSPGERARATGFSRAIARRARRRPELERIRIDLFGGRRFTNGEMTNVLSQVGLRHFDFAWFKRNRIPVFDHQSHYVNPMTHAKQLFLKPNSHIVLAWATGRRTINLSKTHAKFSDCTAKARLPVGSVRIKPDSVIGDIQKAAGIFTYGYDWEEPDAIAFIMTGDSPRTDAISVKEPWSLSGIKYDHLHFTITLRIEPWVSANSVKRAYQRCRRTFTEKQGPPLSETSLALFDFVEERLLEEFGCTYTEIRATEKDTKQKFPIPWGKLADRWNREHKEKYTAGAMSANFKRNYDEIVWRRFTPLGVVKKKKKDTQQGT